MSPSPARKGCTEPGCEWEGYAMHYPRHMLSAHGIVPAAKDDPAPDGGAEDTDEPGSGEDAPTPSAASTPQVEIAPRRPKLLDRLRNRRGRGPGGQQSAPASGERAPKRKRPGAGRRVSLDSDISDLWAFGGRRLEGTAHFPTGRMLEFQAPAAGIILDRAIAGTLPDRLIFQPVARNRDKYEDVAFLLAGPLLTFSITSTGQQIQAALDAGDQEQADALFQKLQVQQEMFRWIVQAMLPRLAVGVKVAREKAEKRAQAIADAFPDLGADDPIEVFASRMFTPPIYQEASHNGQDSGTAGPADSESPLAV